MKRLARPLMIAAALLWSASLQAAIMVFVTTLAGTNENPPNASPGTGFAVVEFDTVAQTLDVHVEFSGLLAPTTDAHIHCCTVPTLNTGVAVGFTPGGFPLAVTAGVFDHTFDLTDAATFAGGFLAGSGGTAALASARLLTGLLDGLAYVNIHTTQFPGGEIRGQLRIPEPGTLLLLGTATLLGLALRRRST